MLNNFIILLLLLSLATTCLQYSYTSSYEPSYSSIYTTTTGASNSQYEHFNRKNPFDIIYEWKILDFEFPTSQERQRAIDSGYFVPKNNLPLGIDIWRNRIFVTMPRWKDGVPASLASLPNPVEPFTKFNKPYNKNLPMKPYPDLSFHADPNAKPPNCNKLMSVYRIYIDECDRLWVLDAGIVNATIKINPVCPPKIVVFNLKNDLPIFSYELPADQIKQDSLHSNIVVDVREGKCHDAFAYVTDVWRYGIVVFSLAVERSWRTTNHLYMPNPLASNYNLHGINFQWVDGVFGISLSPLNNYNDRIMFFHPMSSNAEFMVSTAILRNESLWTDGNTGLPNSFIRIGDRGKNGQSSTSGIDYNNIMFYNLVQQDAVGCWDIDKPYVKGNLGIVAVDNETLIFPNDLKVDKEYDQGVWVISNRLPFYLYTQLNYNDINFRIQRASAEYAVQGTCCDPQYPGNHQVPEFDDNKCY